MIFTRIQCQVYLPLSILNMHYAAILLEIFRFLSALWNGWHTERNLRRLGDDGVKVELRVHVGFASQHKQEVRFLPQTSLSVWPDLPEGFRSKIRQPGVFWIGWLRKTESIRSVSKRPFWTFDTLRYQMLLKKMYNVVWIDSYYIPLIYIKKYI